MAISNVIVDACWEVQLTVQLNLSLLWLLHIFSTYFVSLIITISHNGWNYKFFPTLFSTNWTVNLSKLIYLFCYCTSTLSNGQKNERTNEQAARTSHSLRDCDRIASIKSMCIIKMFHGKIHIGKYSNNLSQFYYHFLLFAFRICILILKSNGSRRRRLTKYSCRCSANERA